MNIFEQACPFILIYPIGLRYSSWPFLCAWASCQWSLGTPSSLTSLDMSVLGGLHRTCVCRCRTSTLHRCFHASRTGPDAPQVLYSIPGISSSTISVGLPLGWTASNWCCRTHWWSWWTGLNSRSPPDGPGDYKQNKVSSQSAKETKLNEAETSVLRTRE